MSPRVKKSVMNAVAAVAAALVLGACQSSTPASRIAANPALFQSLPAAHQMLVQQGRLCEGMNKDAVELAFGAPDGTMSGYKGGKTLETWQYTRMVPVYSPRFHYHHCWHDYYGMDNDWVYVPTMAAEVIFTDGKVSSWMTR